MHTAPVTRLPIVGSLQGSLGWFRSLIPVLGFQAVSLHMLPLCKDLMNLLHVSVVCRELQFCEQNQEFEASQLPLQKCVCRVYTCLTLLLLQQVHLSLLMLQARTRSQAFHEKR